MPRDLESMLAWVEAKSSKASNKLADSDKVKIFVYGGLAAAVIGVTAFALDHDRGSVQRRRASTAAAKSSTTTNNTPSQSSTTSPGQTSSWQSSSSPPRAYSSSPADEYERVRPSRARRDHWNNVDLWDYLARNGGER